MPVCVAAPLPITNYPAMSDLILLDWDPQQVRLLTCSRSGGVLRVRHAESAPLDGDVTAASLINAFSPLVSKVGGARGKAVLVLGGRDLQTRLLRVPPVPEDEMPDIVRLRAGTEFPTADETAIVDYIPLEQPTDVPATVFVARTAVNRLELAKQVCGKLQLTLQHVAIRGAGIAALAIKGLDTLATGTHLVAAQRGDEVDLVGTYQGHLASVRSVPLPKEADLAGRATAVAREIRRTIAAVASELDAPSIESITWLASCEEDLALADRCGRELTRRVTPLNLSQLSCLQIDDSHSQDELSHFASLLGTGLIAETSSLSIDFLSPRKAPEPVKPIRTYVMAAALAAIVILGGGWFVRTSVTSIEATTEGYRNQLQTVENDIKSLSDEVEQSKQVEQWLATDVNWLDELDRIAVTLRPEPLDNHDAFDQENDVILTSVHARQAAGKKSVGGTVELAGVVREFDVINQMEQRLRTDNHQVTQKPSAEHPEDAPYSWSFQNDIVVLPKKEGRS